MIQHVKQDMSCLPRLVRYAALILASLAIEVMGGFGWKAGVAHVPPPDGGDVLYIPSVLLFGFIGCFIYMIAVLATVSAIALAAILLNHRRDHYHAPSEGDVLDASSGRLVSLGFKTSHSGATPDPARRKVVMLRLWPGLATSR